MNLITNTLNPKEAIAYYNKKYIVDYLAGYGFDFKENQLEYHRGGSDLKQVIWHRCDKNNMSGRHINFEIGYYNVSQKFKTWYIKNYGTAPIGGHVIIGNKNLYQEKWNGKYNAYVGVFGYELIHKDIEDQFSVILENLKNVVVPYLDFYRDLNTVIDNPNLLLSGGEFDLFSQLRQIEHCLFLGNIEKAEKISKELLNNKDVPLDYHSYRDTELNRIFNVKKTAHNS